MGVEIERKFLVDHEKWNHLSKPGGSNFRQGYMVKDESKTIRVRVTDEEAFITIKGKTTGLTRSEYEYNIPVADGNELLVAFCEAIISKIRYCIEYAGNVWEVDVFSGDNEGLIMAEIELDDESEIFDLPDWITDEVTGDVRYYNLSLSINPYKNWKA